jgi:hypothetical protein
MKKPVLLGILFLAVVAGVLVYSTLSLNQARVEVCMEFRGAQSCRTASGANRDFALKTAKANACALIASGVTDTLACEHNEPVSVRWLK